MPGVFRRAYRPPPRRQTRRGRWPGSITAALAAGTASLANSGPSGISLTATDATGGVPSYTYQWQRSDNGGSYANISNGGGVTGATTLSLFDGSATVGNEYSYKVVYTDTLTNTATSNAVGPLIVYTGGTVDTGTSTSGTASYGGRFDRGMTGGING